MLDMAFIRKHLKTWIERHIELDAQCAVENMILDFIEDHPEVVGDEPRKAKSWPEIRILAEREAMRTRP